jgi:glutamate dehydrogenase
MTEEVAGLVLRNNVLQVQAISLAEARPAELLDSQAAFMRRLEASGRLNRELEVLPDEETLARRRQAGQGLFRPEVAVLIAYAKTALYHELLASELPDDPYLLKDMFKYFPRPLRKRFREPIAQHRLRREIIATLVANSIVNRGLGEFVSELGEQTGRSITSIARAYIVARDTFALLPLFGELERLAGRIAAPQLNALLGEARLALARGTEWFLRNLPAPIDVGAAVERFSSGIAGLLDKLDVVLSAPERERLTQAVSELRGRGIEAGSAWRLAALPYLAPACEVVTVADVVGTDVVTAGSTYFALDARLHLDRLRARLDRAGPRNHWERAALAGLYEDLVDEHRRLAIQAFGSELVRPHTGAGPEALQEAVASWLQSEVAGFARWQRLLIELDNQPSADLPMLSVAIRTLAALDPSQANAA